MQQLVFHSAAPCGTAVVPHDTRNASPAPFQVSSCTTLMGHRSHIVKTRDSHLAFALHEQALEIDIEPNFTHSRGVWIIGFICTYTERDNALRTVTLCASSLTASEVAA